MLYILIDGGKRYFGFFIDWSIYREEIMVNVLFRYVELGKFVGKKCNLFLIWLVLMDLILNKFKLYLKILDNKWVLWICCSIF